MSYQDIILGLMFCCIGFSLALFAARTINIALLLLMVWVPLKVIEKFGMAADWEGYFRLKNILLSLWRVLLEVFSNIMKTATTGSLVLFTLGSVIGFIVNFRMRAPLKKINKS